MKSLITLALVLFTASVARATVTTCSNSTQTLVYSQRSGGPNEITNLKFQQYSQHVQKSSDAPIDFQLSKVDVKQLQSSGASMLKTSAAYATGSIEGDGNTVNFHDWVVCTELIPNTVAKR